MKNLKYPILSAIISLTFFLLLVGYVVRIGEFINKFFPCVPCEEKVSAEYFICTHEYYGTKVPCDFPICPCFEIYDVFFMFLSIGIFIVSVFLIIFRVVKYLKR